MHRNLSTCRPYAARRGSTLVMLVFMVLAAFSIASYAINVVYMEFARTELQITADVATRAACRALVDYGSQDEALWAAQRLAAANPVRGQVVDIPMDDLQFAVARRYEEEDDYDYSQRLSNPNAVHLTTEFYQRSHSGMEMLFPTLGVPVAFRPIKEATAIQSELDLAVVLDRSSSMACPSSQDSPPENLVELPLVRQLPSDTRWRDAQAGMEEILELFESSPQQELVSLSTFNHIATSDASLSQSYQLLRSTMESHGQQFAGGKSSMADGIRNGLRLLSDEDRARPWASRVMLLISDGRNNFGNDPMAAAREAADQYVMIYTISLSDEANEEVLADIAETTYGRHFHATQPEDFRTIMEEISRRLPILITH
ncbi:MAG: VWA domain-containing protein [Planctomycetales bacterium]|nr:VWA domain-containing protein [Planctomycetales bacterium]